MKSLNGMKVKHLEEHEVEYMWDILKHRQPHHSASSFHIVEHRHSYNGQLFQVLFGIGDGFEEPLGINLLEE